MSNWKWFPWCIALGMGVVISVNMGMVYAALSTFPGIAGSDGFDLSNHYDNVIERMEKQSSLGWVMTVEADAQGLPVIDLAGPNGAALAGAVIEAKAERPVGDPRTRGERFTEVTPGHYKGAIPLDLKGQWDLAIKARAAGHDFVTTRRVIAR